MGAYKWRGVLRMGVGWGGGVEGGGGVVVVINTGGDA